MGGWLDGAMGGWLDGAMGGWLDGAMDESRRAQVIGVCSTCGEEVPDLAEVSPE